MFYGMNTTGDPDWLEVGVAVAARERVVLAWESRHGLFGRVAPLHGLAARAPIPLVMARDGDRLSIEYDPSPREQDGAALLLLGAERRGQAPPSVSTSAVLPIRARATGFEPVRLR
jgi:hypothetical protein